MSIYNIPFSIQRRKKITVKFPKYAAMGYGTKNKFETAVVNEPSVFEPLRFVCGCFQDLSFFNKNICSVTLAQLLNC